MKFYFDAMKSSESLLAAISHSFATVFKKREKRLAELRMTIRNSA